MGTEAWHLQYNLDGTRRFKIQELNLISAVKQWSYNLRQVNVVSTQTPEQCCLHATHQNVTQLNNNSWYNFSNATFCLLIGEGFFLQMALFLKELP